MKQPQDEVAQARKTRLAGSWMINPLVAEIVQALLDLGGSAHRDAILQQIAWRRGSLEVSPGLKREITEAFEVHLARAAETGLDALMLLPFGPNSQRWSLTLKVRRFADQYRTSNDDLIDILATDGKAGAAQAVVGPNNRFIFPRIARSKGRG